MKDIDIIILGYYKRDDRRKISKFPDKGTIYLTLLNKKALLFRSSMLARGIYIYISLPRLDPPI
jgi:hypothetical protein